MKLQPSPVMLSLALALLYSGALSLLVEAPCPTRTVITSAAQALESSPVASTELVRSPGTALRLRMTLPYVPQSPPRTREQQEI